MSKEPEGWKARYLACSDPFDALAVWMDARWSPLEPDERLAFALGVAGPAPDWIENPDERDEHGDLVQDVALMIHAHSGDPEVPGMENEDA